MKVTIDELFIEDSRISNDTSKIYTTLGLKVNLFTGYMKIASTPEAQINKYDKAISVHLKPSFYNKLLNEGVLLATRDHKFILYDSLGTEIFVSKRAKDNSIRIGVLTSGGDSPGMNSALRSIIRTSLKNDITVYGIYRGYEGLIRGDIRKLGWNSEINESGEGGTALLSVRSDAFKTREGRKKAIFNLIKRGINSLIVLGGDGSLTGALVLEKEFQELRNELIRENRFSNNIKNINDLKVKITEDTLMNKSCNENVGSDCFLTTDQNGEKEEHSDSVEIKQSSLSIEKIQDIVSDYSVSEESEEYIPEDVKDLVIVGIPATIDNDIYGTEATLGANTALHRVIETIDRLCSTMRSHKRTFVVECMGRNCGWITMMSAFAVNADYVLIPEAPQENWKDEMMRSIKTAFYNHKSNIYVFLCEGAVDINGNKITLDEVQKVIEDEKMDVRSLVIGHTQRGGPPSAQDMVLGTLGGIKAVEYIISKQKSSKMISFSGENVKLVDLSDVVQSNLKIANFLKDTKFQEIFKIRDSVFQQVCNMFENHRKIKVSKYYRERLYGREDRVGVMHAKADRKHMISIMESGRSEASKTVTKNISKNQENCSRLSNGVRDINIKNEVVKNGNIAETNDVKSGINETNLINKNGLKRKLRIGVIHDGERIPGMNACLNMIVQEGLCMDYDVFYFIEGYDGIENYHAIKAEIFEFSKKNGDGGTCIGVSNIKAVDTKSIRRKLDEMEIDYLIVVGGSRNLQLAYEIGKTILIPATEINNVPGTIRSIGCDTSLNCILKVSEACKMSAFSMKKTIFIIEVGGGNNGYLSVLGGIAAGAFEVICPETCSLEHLINIKKKLENLFKNRRRSSVVIIRSANTFNQMSVESLGKILTAETKFNCYYSVLGTLEKGVDPSPIDRINSNLMAIKAIELIGRSISSGVIGVDEHVGIYTPIEEAILNFNAENETIKNPSWLDKVDICGSLE